MHKGKLRIVIVFLAISASLFFCYCVAADTADDDRPDIKKALNDIKRTMRSSSDFSMEDDAVDSESYNDARSEATYQDYMADDADEEFKYAEESAKYATDASYVGGKEQSDKSNIDPEKKKAEEEPLEEKSAEDIPIKERILIDVLELKDMEISDVIKLLSKKSGLNIVSSRDVKGKVTIYLKDVDVRDALRIILETNDMAYMEENGIIRVMTDKNFELTYGRKFNEKTELKTIQLDYASPSDVTALLNQIKSIIGKVISDDKSNTIVLIDTPERLNAMEMLAREIDVPIETKVFDLNYAKAEDLNQKVSDLLTKNIGNVRYDSRSNKISVTDTPSKISEISRMIDAFDEKHKEVLIEAKIVQVTLSDQYKFGIDWQAIVSDYHSLDLNTNFSILNATDKQGNLSIGTLSSDDYTTLVEALDAIGNSEILSSPRITTLNNEEAKILVGSTEPYVTTTTTTPASGAATTAESVNFIEVGVKLYVTPTIHNDGFITMKIKPEVSSVTSYLTTSNNNTIPIVDTSEAETTVMVKDGVTIVIGGLIKDETIETIKKIPLLGDLPLLGFAFRNKDNFMRKTELVIFLTPNIISGDVQSIHHMDYDPDIRKGIVR